MSLSALTGCDNVRNKSVSGCLEREKLMYGNKSLIATAQLSWLLKLLYTAS